MSKFPNTGLSLNGNSVIDKAKVDNVAFFDNLDSLGPNWGESFVSPMNCAFSDGSERYKLLHSYMTGDSLNGLLNYSHGVASTGTDLFLCGSSSVRPSKYNIATNTWSEGSLSYNDYGSINISTGAFGYNGNAYFYTNNPGLGTAVNFLQIKKYDPVANTWADLTSLSSGNMATVVYGFMGIANGYAYFMQMIKSSNSSYVPIGFPSVQRYQFASDTWSSAAVAPPLLKNGGLAASGQGYDYFLRGNNSVSCKLSATEFIIHVKGFLNDDITLFQSHNTEEMYKFDATANTFQFLCRFKSMGKESPLNKVDSSTTSLQAKNRKIWNNSRIFYDSGIVYLWYPWQKGLRAYSIEEQKQYFIPIESSAIWSPIVCQEGGKVFMFLGYTGVMDAYSMINNNGIIIDIAAISAFLNRGKTVAVNARYFA